MVQMARMVLIGVNWDKKGTPPTMSKALSMPVSRLSARAEFSATDRRGRCAAAGVGILEPIILRLLKLLLRKIQGQAVVLDFKTNPV
jgi:hypothetical protein